MTTPIKITFVQPPEIAELSAAADVFKLSEDLRNTFLGLCDTNIDLFRVESDSASGTDIVLAPKPTDRLAEFLSTLRASEIYPLVVKRMGVHSAGVTANQGEVNAS